MLKSKDRLGEMYTIFISVLRKACRVHIKKVEICFLLLFFFLSFKNCDEIHITLPSSTF
jgi:hypothetical protein